MIIIDELHAGGHSDRGTPPCYTGMLCCMLCFIYKYKFLVMVGNTLAKMFIKYDCDILMDSYITGNKKLNTHIL